MARQSIGPALFLAATMAIGVNAAQADEVKVMASAAVKEAYLDPVPEY
jgi:hypothetical protein